MKHYAENLGTNVAAMIKVRQVDYLLKVMLYLIHVAKRVQG